MTTTTEIWRLRLHGERFKQGEIPLEVLQDIAALGEMLTCVAEWRRMSVNPGGQRSFQEFTARNSLNLACTGASGHAAVTISVATAEPPTPYSLASRHLRFFQVAAGDIGLAVATPEGPLLPARFLAYFDRAGRSLRAGERLEMPRPGDPAPARLTPEVRLRLLRRAGVGEITEHTALRGEIPEMNLLEMTFTLKRADGTRITGPVAEEHKAVIMEAFSGYRDGAKVLLQGVGRRDRKGRPAGLESIARVSLLDPLDVPAQLDELRNLLQEGWPGTARRGGDDGTGKAPDTTDLDLFQTGFERHYPGESPLPRISSAACGGLMLEWSAKSQRIRVEVNLEDRRATYEEPGGGQKTEFNWEQPQGWRRLGRMAAQMEE